MILSVFNTTCALWWCAAAWSSGNHEAAFGWGSAVLGWSCVVANDYAKQRRAT